MSTVDIANMSSPDAIKLLMLDPVMFSKGVLRHKLWSKQEEIIRSVANNRRTAVKGANGCGKAFAAADAACWWLNRFKDGVVIVTSPSATQLKRVMWSYIHRNVKQWRTRDWVINQLEVRISPENYILGFTTDSPERFSGWHGQVLIIVDEAPGVAQYIWEAIDGIQAAGDVRLLALGNPTISGGDFYAAFTHKTGAWKTISISAFDTPNLSTLTPMALLSMSDDELDKNPWPELTRRRWVLDMLRTHGEASPLWEARVLGNFPSQSTTSLYPLQWLESAQQHKPDPGGPIIAGLDVAGAGEDETSLTIRCRDVILKQIAWSQADPREAVAATLWPYRDRLMSINVDSDGIGYYFAQYLKDCFGEQRVAEIHVGVPSVDPERWVNYKAEIYWMVRELLSDGSIKNWSDREAFGQASSVRYKQDAKGRIVIESKDDVRKRGLASPDRLESLILSYIAPRMLAGVPRVGLKR